MEEMVNEFINSVINAKTREEERKLVSDALAHIRSAFKTGTAQHIKQAAFLKILYINMLGYPVQFAQMECMNLIAQSSYTEKRTGYVTLSLVSDEKQEVLLLSTNILVRFVPEEITRGFLT